MFAIVWHFWISVLLIVPIVLVTVVMAVWYLNKVVKPKYPGVDQERA